MERKHRNGTAKRQWNVNGTKNGTKIYRQSDEYPSKIQRNSNGIPTFFFFFKRAEFQRKSIGNGTKMDQKYEMEWNWNGNAGTERTWNGKKQLMCSFGQDALDSLYLSTVHKKKRRVVMHFVIVCVTACLHSLLLFVHVTTLTVAVNSSDQVGACFGWLLWLIFFFFLCLFLFCFWLIPSTFYYVCTLLSPSPCLL